MNEFRFSLPRSAPVPTNFHAPPTPPTPTSTSTSIPNLAGKKRLHNHNNNHHQPPLQQSSQQPTKIFRSHPSASGPPSSTLSQDYHLRMPVVTDNPKKLSQFDFIRIVPKGEEYAVYLQHNTLTFFPRTSSIPSATIPLGKGIHPPRQLLFFCTMVKAGFFVITDLVFSGNRELSTNKERISTLVSVLKQGMLSEICHRRENVQKKKTGSPTLDSHFENITFHSTHLFTQWTDFAKGSLHLPYEIKHLEYCFWDERLLNQRNRYIYILNKKTLRKSTHDTDLVCTTSRDFRIDVTKEKEQHHPPPVMRQDFRTSVFLNQPYINVLGYSHLDKQEESEEEEDECVQKNKNIQ